MWVRPSLLPRRGDDGGGCGRLQKPSTSSKGREDEVHMVVAKLKIGKKNKGECRLQLKVNDRDIKNRASF